MAGFPSAVHTPAITCRRGCCSKRNVKWAFCRRNHYQIPTQTPDLYRICTVRRILPAKIRQHKTFENGIWRKVKGCHLFSASCLMWRNVSFFAGKNGRILAQQFIGKGFCSESIIYDHILAIHNSFPEKPNRQ